MADNELLLAISNMLNPLRQDVKEIRERVKKVELTQENVVLPRLQNIEAVMEHSEKLQKFHRTTMCVKPFSELLNLRTIFRDSLFCEE